MKKDIQHINFESRDAYKGKTNMRRLSDEFFAKGYSLPLWATDKQFERSGFQIKENAQPVKVQFVIDKQGQDADVRYYPLFNFEQTVKPSAEAIESLSQTEDSTPHWSA